MSTTRPPTVPAAEGIEKVLEGETPQAPPPMGPGPRTRFFRAVMRPAFFFLLTCAAFFTALPFLWMIMGSLKPNIEVEEPHILPREWQWENYAIVLRLQPDKDGVYLDIDFAKWYFNSMFVSVAITYLQLLTSAMAAYAFSRIIWPGRDKVFFLYLATMMIPPIVLMIPNFQIMVLLGFVDSYQGLILPAAFGAFGTFLLRQFMLTIPPSLDEAARIDGASHWQAFWEVILPLARPGLVTLAIFTMLASFQSFFWPLVMLKSEHLFTLPIGLLNLDSTYGRQTELILAATVMSVLPLVVLFVILQKQLIRGIQLGAVKG